MIIGGRNLQLAPGAQPQFASTATAGIHVDGDVYPVAFLAPRPGLAWSMLSGLGVGLTLDAPFWPNAVPCARDSTGRCIATNESYGVHEVRVEAGLRWRFAPLAKPRRVEVLASIQYGAHSFTIDKPPTGMDLGPPDVVYQYVTFGVGARAQVWRIVSVHALLNVHALASEGPINAATELGPGSGYGVRFLAGAEVAIWRGLYARVDGFYERFGLSFDGASATPPPAKIGTGGADQYYGSMLSVGWLDDGQPARAAAAEAAPRPVPTGDRDGDGVPDATDRCPDAAGPASLSGCPDGDGDGVPDVEDKCPQGAGPASLGGCPDGDGDGVPDVEDECPATPGEVAERGCPAYTRIKVTPERIELLEKVAFLRDREIASKSHALLDEVVKALGDRPGLRLRIAGHTDDAIKEKRALEVSAARAEAVMEYLVSHGVDGGRLESQGFGAQYPIDTNKTAAGRENNRRIELQIVK
jgi:outer membrane protein OmpA-like peptidoglycan-associated protein